MPIKCKKKILYISPNGYLGGAERVVINLSKSHLSRNNFIPKILFFSNGEAVCEARKIGIECLVLNTIFRIRNPFSLFIALFEIRKIIKQENPELIHNTMAYSHLIISLSTIGLKFKKVWFQHGPVGKLIDKLASFFPVHLLFFNGQYLKEQHFMSRPHVKIIKSLAIIPLGIDLTKENRDIFNEDCLTFGTAGRICKGKSYDYIIEAFGQLKTEGEINNFKLVIAGSPKTTNDENYLKALINLILFYNLKEEIKILGHIQEMSSFYQNLDVFIHSTIRPEPFGLVIAEAMSYGCLVIGSDQGGVKDLISNQIRGLTYSSTISKEQAIKELKDKIKTLFQNSDKESYKEMAKNGKSFIEKNYSIQKMRDSVEEHYLSLYD